RREVIAFAGLAAGLWATLVSHAAASGDIKIMALDFVHVVAISVWSGGLLAFLVVAFPAVREERALGAMPWRFSLTAPTCVELLMPTTNPGRNRYVLRVYQGLAPVTNAEKVSLRYTMVEHDMGEQELVAEQRAPGEYVAEGSPTAMFGTWKVLAIVRIPARLDVRALFTV